MTTSRKESAAGTVSGGGARPKGGGPDSAKNVSGVAGGVKKSNTAGAKRTGNKTRKTLR